MSADEEEDSTMMDTTILSHNRPNNRDGNTNMGDQEHNHQDYQTHPSQSVRPPRPQQPHHKPQRKHHSRAWEAQKEIWRLEQNIVAAFVRVQADPPVDSTIVGDNPLFHLVKHDHLDIFSFSSKPELYGGVDVSFSIHPPTSSTPTAAATTAAASVETSLPSHTQQQQEHEQGKRTHHEISIPTNHGTRSSKDDDDDDELIMSTEREQLQQWQHDVDVEDDTAVAVYVIIDKRTMTVVYQDFEYFVPQVPYMPGFIAFREIQPLEDLIQRQKTRQPDLTPSAILVEGHGLWHERRAGIACVLGQRTDLPTIGVTQTVSAEGGWSLGDIGSQLDDFVSEFHTTVGQHATTLAPILSRYRGLILKKQPVDPNPNRHPQTNGNETASSTTPAATTTTPTITHDRGIMLQHLTPYCNGIGIFLRGNGEDSDPPAQASSTHHRKPLRQAHKFPAVLACALVGQGGQIAVASAAQPIAGAVDPILISVGHRISLQRAVQICASLSVARPLPEPVRQAALLGQKLLRGKRQQKQQRQQQQPGTRRSTM